VVAILIFALGGGMSVYEGVTHLSHPQVHHSIWNYVVLGFAIVFESFSFLFCVQGLSEPDDRPGSVPNDPREQRPHHIHGALRRHGGFAGVESSPSSVSFWGHLLNNPYLDGVASIVIGAILAVVAGFLAYESKGLLIGEGVDPQTLASIRSIVSADPAVEEIKKLLTMHFSPDDVLLTLDIGFKKHLTRRKSRLR